MKGIIENGLQLNLFVFLFENSFYYYYYYYYFVLFLLHSLEVVKRKSGNSMTILVAWIASSV